MKKTTLSAIIAVAALSIDAGAVARAANDRMVLAPTAVTPGAHDLGHLTADVPLRLEVGLKLRDTAGLDALLLAQSTPASPLYRHFLRPTQIRDAFGASASDYARVSMSLVRAGFLIGEADPLRASITVTADARTVERYFSTRLDRISGSSRRVSYANVTPATAPAGVADIVASVTGLSNAPFYTMPAQSAYCSYIGCNDARTARAGVAAMTKFAPLYGPDGGYGPAFLIDAFDLPAKHGFTGTGVTVADLVDGTISDASDIAPYLAEFGIRRTGPPTETVSVKGYGCGANCTDFYASVADAEAVLGTAPGVAYRLYDLPILQSLYIVEGLQSIVRQNVADIVNISFAACETNFSVDAPTFDEYFKIGAAEGMTFESIAFGGSNPCGAPSGFSVQIPSDSPHVLAVGGADSFVRNGSQFRAPIVNAGSGGGVSVLFPKPHFQDGVPAGSARTLPDVAGPAAINSVGPSVFSSSGGGWVGGGVVYVSNAPIAGGLAELVQIEGTRLGIVANSWYAKYTRKPGDFNDVTSGCNGAGGVEPYCAGPGYDIVSGLGEPLFYKLAQ